MKKIVTFLAVAIALSSCSNDDDKNNKEEFFNLEVGNQWVYKRYEVNESKETYFGKTDTVKVVSTETIDGKQYFKITHTDWIGGQEEFLRIDNNNHLVSSSGFVQHPGTDKSFTDSRASNSTADFGTLSYTLKDMTKITVEGKDYEVYPYSGYFTNSPPNNFPEGESSIDAYSKGIGFVIKKYRYISSATGFIEYRLASYELK